MRLIKGLPESYGRYLFVSESGSIHEGFYGSRFEGKGTEPLIKIPCYYKDAYMFIKPTEVIGYLDLDLHLNLDLSSINQINHQIKEKHETN
jgi:hypothetical protein